MNILIGFVKDYGEEIIHSVVLGVFSYVALDIKRIHKKHVQDVTKKDVIKMVCRYIDEIYPNKSGEAKLNEAIVDARAILKEKGIVISDLELRVLLHNSIYVIQNELEVKK